MEDTPEKGLSSGAQRQRGDRDAELAEQARQLVNQLDATRIWEVHITNVVGGRLGHPATTIEVHGPYNVEELVRVQQKLSAHSYVLVKRLGRRELF